VTDATFKEDEETYKFFGYKGSPAVPARPCGKDRLKTSEAFRSGESGQMKTGVRRELISFYSALSVTSIE
jgi:hypothetical protein